MGMYGLVEDQEQRVAAAAEACLLADYLHRGGDPTKAPPYETYNEGQREVAERHARAMLAATQALAQPITEQPSPVGEIKITQADRNAAADYYKVRVEIGMSAVKPAFIHFLREGRVDNHDLIVAFARHRLTTSPALDRIKVLEEELAWYGEQARLARLIHSEGDAGRHALAGDGGKRARAALGGRHDR